MIPTRNWIASTIAGFLQAGTQKDDRAYPRESVSAIGGLAYACSRDIYCLLIKHGVIDRALRYEVKGRVAKEKLLERIAIAYLWNEDELGSERLAHFFKADGGDDLVTITHLFWSVRREGLSNEQRERILQFWERCVKWSREVATNPDGALSTLASLTSVLDSADGRNRELLEAVGPYVHIGYNAHEFVEDLSPLVDVSPDGSTSCSPE